ncbi:MAG: 6-hydroxymethylpterin diphosphokinase MptE-like protein [Halobacteriaceae archaeon]
MRFAEWAPAYEAILADFGFDRDADRAARDLIDELVGPFPESRLEALFRDAHVAIAGPTPDVAAELAALEGVDTIVAASTSAATLQGTGHTADIVVTDLDKVPERLRTLTAAGTPVSVHAHGDNTSLIREQVPQLTATEILATTQARPAGAVRNFGGFTDGDRGAFIADHFGARRLSFPGWDLDDPTVEPMKAKKLQWAARLLYWLERRRDEQFDLLDERRAALTLPWR